MIILILIVFVLVLIVLYSKLYFIREGRRCKVPGPPPIPIIGNGHRLLGGSSEILEFLSLLIKEFGDISQIYLLSQRWLIIVHPKHAEAIVSNNDHNTKADTYKYLHPWLGRGLLTASGNRWKTHRKFLTPAFHFNILKTFLPIFLKNDEIFIEKLKILANGKPFDVFPIFALLALDNISESAMGVSVNAQSNSESEYVRAVDVISEIAFSRMSNMFLGNDFLFKLSSRKRQQDKALKILHGQTNTVIRNRRRLLEELNATLENYDTDLGATRKPAFLDLLLLSSIEGKQLDDESIREEVDTFMFEGHDTTASGLSFALYCISRDNAVQDKLFKEQEKVFSKDMKRHPHLTDLNNMKYLEAVIKESFRLYPPVPVIARLIAEDTNICEYFIPKNTTAIISILSMQRNEKIYEDPLSFRPERFEDMKTDQKSAYNWMAFSAGSRNCIGQKFAMMEMKTVLSSVIRRFHILPSNIEPVLRADLILRSQNGILVKLLPRK